MEPPELPCTPHALLVREHQRELLLLSCTLKGVDSNRLTCRDKNFLYHSSGAWYSIALSVKVTELPSLLLGSGSPIWNITRSKHRPGSLRFAVLFFQGRGESLG